jgi:hypothetical protein
MSLERIPKGMPERTSWNTLADIIPSCCWLKMIRIYAATMNAVIVRCEAFKRIVTDVIQNCLSGISVAPCKHDAMSPVDATRLSLFTGWDVKTSIPTGKKNWSCPS